MHTLNTWCVLARNAKQDTARVLPNYLCPVRLFFCKTKTDIYVLDVLLMVRAGNALELGKFCQNAGAVFSLSVVSYLSLHTRAFVLT